MAHAPLAHIIAHRGASADAPENTLSALALAAKHGARCVEIDVSISKDDVAYVHHDATLERCTNGNGLLSEQPSEQLDQLYAGSNKPGFEYEPLPRLSATLKLLTEHALGLNLEIKPMDGLEQRTVEAICLELKSHWPAQLPLVVSSFNHESLGIFKQLMPHMATALLFDNVPNTWQEHMQHYSAQNVHCAQDKITSEIASNVIDAEYGLYCYTVNEPAKAKTLIDWGVHGIFTDHPKFIAAQLEI